MKKYGLCLDLKDDPALIEAYDKWHRQVWPEITESIRAAGILRMEIFRNHTRLFMLIEAGDEFSFERKEEMDRENTKVAEWEELMWKYQQQLPGAQPGEKWMVMKNIFSLGENS